MDTVHRLLAALYLCAARSTIPFFLGPYIIFNMNFRPNLTTADRWLGENENRTVALVYNGEDADRAIESELGSKLESAEVGRFDSSRSQS